MIGRIHGMLLEKSPTQLLVDVSGLGYEVHISMNTFTHLPDVSNKILLHTHFIVREDAQILYGFYEEQERALFKNLIKINGVGPKSAIAILSSTTPKEFQRYVVENDTAGLVKLPGVGKKTAERLLIEMRDKLKTWHPDVSESFPGITHEFTDQQKYESEAIEALIALGYKPLDASKSIARVKKPGMSSEELIRSALQRAS